MECSCKAVAITCSSQAVCAGRTGWALAGGLPASAAAAEAWMKHNPRL